MGHAWKQMFYLEVSYLFPTYRRPNGKSQIFWLYTACRYMFLSGTIHQIPVDEKRDHLVKIMWYTQSISFVVSAAWICSRDKIVKRWSVRGYKKIGTSAVHNFSRHALGRSMLNIFSGYNKQLTLMDSWVIEIQVIFRWEQVCKKHLC